MDENILAALQKTITSLRGEGGCPWDKKQTAKTLVKYIRNETEELIEAIEKEDTENVCEELGDVLFLVCMVSTINEEQRNFTFNDVVKTVNEKLIRRHPHVFADTTYKSDEELEKQWEAIKAEEKRMKKKKRA